MIEKHIKGIITKKLIKWYESIEDEKVRKIAEKNTIVTGGSIVSLMQNEKPKDYDIYFKDYESAKIIAEYYVNKFNENNDKKEIKLLDPVNIEEEINSYKNLPEKEQKIEVLKELQSIQGIINYRNKLLEKNKDRLYLWIQSKSIITEDSNESTICEEKVFEDIYDSDEIKENEEKPKYRPVWISANAITLSDKIQLVFRFYGEPEDIHETYDYVHTKAYYTSWDKKLEIPKEVYQAVLNKTLIYTGSLYPICSLFRMRKFIKRGWTINAGQILKISMQISELDLNDLGVLEDQLVGVDSAFFDQLIDALKNKKEKDENFGFDYMTAIIEKIFG